MRYDAGYEVIDGRLGGNPLVSIAVAGPTAASAEMLLPNGYKNDQTPSGGPATSANCLPSTAQNAQARSSRPDNPYPDWGSPR
jgi:hypothetical protein